MLICPVRGCGKPLTREEQRWVCPQSHSFDIARSGYVNLLQPQDKRSKEPGDSAAAVAARRRLHDRGVTEPLLRGLTEFDETKPNDVVLDAGCGDGFYLGRLQETTAAEAHGVDLSIPAVNLAARRFPRCSWLVANADRFLPYADATFTKLMSITARMNSAEFRRVLRPDGRLLVAVPSPEDLVELRGVGRDRVERTVATFEKDFRVVNHGRIGSVADLDDDATRDLLASIYRPLQSKPVEAGRVTFSLDLLLLQPK